MWDVETSVAILRRVADLLEQEEGNGGLANLDPEKRVAISDLAAAAAEAARATREIYGALTTGAERPYDGRRVVRTESTTRLPLNRKERFYTGTVLPMLLAYDAFAHLGRFLSLCGLSVEPIETRRDGCVPCQLLTEYGFAESILPLHDDRWDSRPRRRDTPDLVLVGPDWLLAVEGKMFDRPSRAELELQLDGQKTLIEEWAAVLHRSAGEREAHRTATCSAG